MTSQLQARPMGPDNEAVACDLSNSSCLDVTAQLSEDLGRLISEMMGHLETTFGLVQRVQKSIREHDQQVEHFFHLMKNFESSIQTLGFVKDSEPSTKKEAEIREPETPQEFKVQPTEVCQLLDKRPSLTEADEPLESQPAWEQEPQFWQDVLTQQLWQIYFDGHKKGLGALRTTEKIPEQESKDLNSSLSSILPETPPSPSPQELATASKQESSLEAREPSELGRPFLQPLCWDHEDFKDSRQRPGVSLWKSKRFAVPRALHKVRALKHGEPLLAAAVSSFSRHAFTCSRGGIKVWSLTGQVAEDRFPDSHLKLGTQNPSAYMRTCLLSPDSRTLLAGGENLPAVSVWDLAAPSLYVKYQLPCEGLSCQALAVSLEDNQAFAGCKNGTMRMWDLRSQKVVRDFTGPVGGAKCLVVKDNVVWTGGLDACLRRWDVRTAREAVECTLQSQIMSLSHSPQEDWMLMGLANGQHCLYSATQGGPALTVGAKEKTILGLKFSPDGQWWVSVGMDDLTSLHSMPSGAKVFQVREAASTTCCDVAANGRVLVTGSGDQASVYQITY